MSTASTIPETTQMPASAVPRQASPRGFASLYWSARDNLDFPAWVEQGRRLGAMGRVNGWWIGDWLRYGNYKFGERYARASTITGYDPQSLMNFVYVASRFEISRRRENLSWSHHAEVAALAPELQDEWLDRAQADRLSVQALREELRSSALGKRRASARATREVAVSKTNESKGSVVCPNCGHRYELATET